MPPSVLMNILFGIGGLYAAYGGLLFFAQRQMLFPRGFVGAAPQDLKLPSQVRIEWMKMPFGEVETYLMLPEKETFPPPVPVVIFAHGNGERIDFWPEALSPFLRLGMGVLMVEYPGYGRSAGVPSQKTVTEVFVAAYDFLAAHPEVDSSRMVLMGRSLGGGAVCALAAERPAKALMLMSTFTSVHALARRFLVPVLLVRDPFDNLAVVRAFEGPILVVHGTRDETIPYVHGKALVRNARNGRFISYPSGHNDCPPDWAVFFREVEAFLKESDILS